MSQFFLISWTACFNLTIKAQTDAGIRFLVESQIFFPVLKVFGSHVLFGPTGTFTAVILWKNRKPKKTDWVQVLFCFALESFWGTLAPPSGRSVPMTSEAVPQEWRHSSGMQIWLLNNEEICKYSEFVAVETVFYK